MDDELTGGQLWWATIIQNIQLCDVFVLAFSPGWLHSKACEAELRHAVACHRIVLPVLIADVNQQLVPPALASVQQIDYRSRTIESGIALMTALAACPAAPPLPSPPPQAPEVPMSYMNTYREQLDAVSLTFQQQAQLLSELRARLGDPYEKATALELIQQLRRRADITESVGREIDGLSTSEVGPQEPERGRASTLAGQPEPAGWRPDPFGRFEVRYWNGSEWTDHVSRAGVTTRDPAGYRQPSPPGPPGFAGPPRAAQPIVAAAGAKWDATSFALMLAASLMCLPLLGIIMGALNLKQPARRSQAQMLLWVGIGAAVLWFVIGAASVSNQTL